MRQEHIPGGHGPWFQGWYLKHQGGEGGLALIPALHRERRGEWTASLQVITPEESRMVRYPGRAFQLFDSPFQLRLGDSWFSRDGVYLDVDEPGFSLKGELWYGPFQTPERDIMGPFRHVPHMQCVHGIVSMGHQVDGVVTLNGKTALYTGGRGYIESDRGRSFPRRYLWAQSNWRGRQSVALMLAVAHIPMPVGSFTGCICQIQWAGKPLRLATYQGARVERWSEDGALIRQGELALAVDVLARREQPLRAPSGGTMSRTIHESLFATLRCRLWRGEALLFDYTDGEGSFEYSEQSKGTGH